MVAISHLWRSACNSEYSKLFSDLKSSGTEKVNSENDVTYYRHRNINTILLQNENLIFNALIHRNKISLKYPCCRLSDLELKLGSHIVSTIAFKTVEVHFSYIRTAEAKVYKLCKVCKLAECADNL